ITTKSGFVFTRPRPGGDIRCATELRRTGARTYTPSRWQQKRSALAAVLGAEPCGHYRWIDDTGIPRAAQDGTFLGYIGSCGEVHESGVRLEKEVMSRLHTEQRLQDALAIGGVTAYEWDASTDLVRRSNNAAQNLGYDPQRPLDGKSFFAQVHPDD